MKRIIVFGLGIFGFELAVELSGKGIEVIAIDKNKDAVQRIKDTCAKAIVADATEKGLLESIGMDKNDIAVISFGEDLSASTLLTLHLKELGVQTVIVKVPNDDHRRVLKS